MIGDLLLGVGVILQGIWYSANQFLIQTKCFKLIDQQSRIASEQAQTCKDNWLKCCLYWLNESNIVSIVMQTTYCKEIEEKYKIGKKRKSYVLGKFEIVSSSPKPMTDIKILLPC